MNFKPETLAEAEKLIECYPEKRSAALPLLHLAQAEQGYVSEEAGKWVAEKLGLQPISIAELVTFYPGFRQKPVGKHLVRVCRTISCELTGGKKICELLQEELRCLIGETSEDGLVTLQWCECLACCGKGPAVMVDDEIHEKVDEAKVKEIATKLLQ